MGENGENSDSGQGKPSTSDSGTASGHDPLAIRLGELARSLQDEPDAESLLVGVVRAAIEMIPGVEEASISVVINRKSVGSQAASDEMPRVVDHAQEDTGQGPCLDAAYEHKTVRIADMRTEQRWPVFARRALDAGAGSMLALQLFVKGDNLGALNLYSRKPGAFNDESEHIGLLFAAHAAVAYAEILKLDQLGLAIVSHDIVGPAKGILMERFDLNEAQAFQYLLRLSQTTNIKLRDIASELLKTRQLPGDHPKPSK